MLKEKFVKLRLERCGHILHVGESGIPLRTSKGASGLGSVTALVNTVMNLRVPSKARNFFDQ
jgi:hypothetical protein